MKNVFIIFLLLALQLTSPASVLASEDTGDEAGSDSNTYNDSVSQTILNNSEIDPLNGKFDNPSSIINDLLPYLLSGAGIILFAMLIMGGFDVMTAVNDAKKAEAGKSRITAAVIGFVIIFAAYWIAQILEVLFGVSIL